MKKTRAFSFLITALIYVVALAVAAIVFYLLAGLHLLIVTLIADIVATIVVWAFGLFFKNSSVYDPYWSFVPIPIVILWTLLDRLEFGLIEILYLTAIIIWGTRLTYNWIKRWRGLGHQDWRYTMLKAKAPSMWFFTNLFGINLFPTLIVFICMIPVYYGIFSERAYNLLTILGFLISIGSVIIQAVSDRQMDDFKKEHPGCANIDSGLWKYSRHPNYFGEVMFWWGLYVMQLSVSPGIWFTIIAPVAMTMLFLFISIPMMEDHIMISRPGYIPYREQVSKFVPWPRRMQEELQAEEEPYDQGSHS